MADECYSEILQSLWYVDRYLIRNALELLPIIDVRVGVMSIGFAIQFDAT